MAQFEITITYHKAFEKVKMITAKSYEAAEEKANKIASAMEEKDGIMCVEIDSIFEAD